MAAVAHDVWCPACGQLLGATTSGVVGARKLLDTHLKWECRAPQLSVQSAVRAGFYMKHRTTPEAEAMRLQREREIAAHEAQTRYVGTPGHGVLHPAGCRCKGCRD